jgi:hypothetical protein
MNFLFVFCKDIPNLGATSDVRYVLLRSLLLYILHYLFFVVNKKRTKMKQPGSLY